MENNNQESLLRVEHLCQYFKKGKFSTKAVDDVSFDIKKGEVFGLVGESGCGKTTTGRSIIKIYNCTSGSVYFKGQRICAGTGSYRDAITRAKKEYKEQVKELKAAVIRGAAAEQKVRELKVENQQLQQKIPSTKEKLKEAQERQRLENENRQLKVQVEYLEEDLSRARGFSARLQEGIGAVLDFLDRHLPEQFRPLVEKARELLPVPEVQQPEREQERSHTWGGMEL